MPYPEEADVFTDIEADDPLIESDPNVAYTGIENTQGFIGALGKPQSWSTTLLTLARRYRRGMGIEVNGGTLKVLAGEAILENTDSTKLVARRNPADVTLSTVNIDAGTIAATYYYIYAQAPSAATTAPIIFSTDEYAPSGIGTAPYVKTGWFENAIAASLTPTFAGDNLDVLGGVNIVEATLTATFQTSSAAYVTLPTAEVHLLTTGGIVRIDSLLRASNSGADSPVHAILEIDGAEKNETQSSGSTSTPGTAGTRETLTPKWTGVLAAGIHIIKIKWRAEGNTAFIGSGQLTAQEFK